MPRKRRMKGGSAVSKINTANRDLRLQNKLLSANPPLQQPGQLSRPKQWGGALTDKYGAYMYIPRSYM